MERWLRAPWRLIDMIIRTFASTGCIASVVTDIWLATKRAKAIMMLSAYEVVLSMNRKHVFFARHSILNLRDVYDSHRNIHWFTLSRCIHIGGGGGGKWQNPIPRTKFISICSSYMNEDDHWSYLNTYALCSTCSISIPHTSNHKGFALTCYILSGWSPHRTTQHHQTSVYLHHQRIEPSWIYYNAVHRPVNRHDPSSSVCANTPKRRYSESL